ncbi:creatininase family protein [Belnapia sp. T6]|uniref:Creatininase family protein n=1 Tax=Belnapia mucosa TaxID=2804532 RepID=A0ABS1V4Q5_9PROT|nr:creatininase family protein [Belnapia mucosa]MBL6456646.1 creatininase family protein [Belnapia mucosa]
MTERDPGTSILAGTMAEMTYAEVEAAARSGAVALWAFGVIEQHGPHLPTGTDIYLPAAKLRRTRALLAERGIGAVIVPAYYWGVNHVSGAFPASPRVRPEVMAALMEDVIASLSDDGFRHLFCVTGHGDAEHNRTIYEGVRRGSAGRLIRASFLAETRLVGRLGLAADDPLVTPFEPAPSGPSRPFLDVHAGEWETSAMLATHPALVRDAVLPSLVPTNFGPEDLAEWRRGLEHARRKTPHGYLGDPAAADPELGRRSLEAQAVAMADAIAARIAGG